MIPALVSLSSLDSVETENTKPTERPITINNLGFVLVFVNVNMFVSAQTNDKFLDYFHRKYFLPIIVDNNFPMV